MNATTRRDANKNIVGAVGVAQDATEDAKHDQAVAAMARELCQLIDTANAPMIIHKISRDRVVTFYNHHFILILTMQQSYVLLVAC